MCVNNDQYEDCVNSLYVCNIFPGVLPENNSSSRMLVIASSIRRLVTLCNDYNGSKQRITTKKLHVKRFLMSPFKQSSKICHMFIQTFLYENYLVKVLHFSHIFRDSPCTNDLPISERSNCR